MMALEDTEEHVQATLRENELRDQLDVLKNQVTELIKAREIVTENTELFSKVQNLKETLGAHSKQLEQSAEKLSQLEAENLVIRDENQALHTTGSKGQIF
uniref:Uncharacterized protein n=1 Tax=Brassica oleracea TaxID=3712 RepID=A0A3P6F8Z2_BRAOL|nr:unnamed protein product [Brassica oleracea]